MVDRNKFNFHFLDFIFIINFLSFFFQLSIILVVAAIDISLTHEHHEDPDEYAPHYVSKSDAALIFITILCIYETHKQLNELKICNLALKQELHAMH